MSGIQVIPSGEFEIIKRTKTAFYVRLDKKTVPYSLACLKTSNTRCRIPHRP